jgi:hypothetical protein
VLPAEVVPRHLVLTRPLGQDERLPEVALVAPASPRGPCARRRRSIERSDLPIEGGAQNVVRVRTPTAEDWERCRRALEAAGLAVESSLTWLAARDANADLVNRAHRAGGALGRVILRERTLAARYVRPQAGCRARRLRASAPCLAHGRRRALPFCTRRPPAAEP